MRMFRTSGRLRPVALAVVVSAFVAFGRGGRVCGAATATGPEAPSADHAQLRPAPGPRTRRHTGDRPRDLRNVSAPDPLRRGGEGRPRGVPDHLAASVLRDGEPSAGRRFPLHIHVPGRRRGGRPHWARHLSRPRYVQWASLRHFRGGESVHGDRLSLRGERAGSCVVATRPWVKRPGRFNTNQN
jgi:hypothetical protein